MKRVSIVSNFIFRLKEFMQGRNGIDKLSYGILVLYCILAFVKIFFRNSCWGYIIVSVLQYIVLAYMLFRILSKNLEKRYGENVKFERLISRLMTYFNHLKMRVTFFRTHRFRTCKHCREFLRLKKSRGKREVTCPKCGRISKFYFIF